MSARSIASHVVIASISLALLAGCSTPRNAQLDSARASYRGAVDGGLDPASSVDLYEANKLIETAQKALEGGEDAAEVSSIAYRAQRRVEIARLQADTLAMREKTKALNAQRSEYRIEARALEARRAAERAAQAERMSLEAQQLAQRARAEAEQAHLAQLEAADRAKKAEASAAALEARLSEMETRQSERGLVLTLGGVLFALDSANLKPEAQERIDRIAGFLIAAPDREALIEGYTDDTGTDAYNLDLSTRRAQSVRRALVDAGVGPDRLVASGYGNADPVAPNDSAENRARNRRVEIVILDPGEKAQDAVR